MGGLYPLLAPRPVISRGARRLLLIVLAVVAAVFLTLMASHDGRSAAPAYVPSVAPAATSNNTTTTPTGPISCTPIPIVGCNWVFIAAGAFMVSGLVALAVRRSILGVAPILIGIILVVVF